MTTLTQCQQQVLDMLISYQKERGFPPTNQEVATMLGYRSVNAAVEHLRALEKKGVITIKRGVARGITLHTAVKDDDSQVKRMLVEWGPVIPEGKVEITISKYEKTAGAAA